MDRWGGFSQPAEDPAVRAESADHDGSPHGTRSIP
jgi:hypothetical protein